MFTRLLTVLLLIFVFENVFAQEKFTVVKDLRSEWAAFDDGAYHPLDDVSFTGLSTIYFPLDPVSFGGKSLRLKSDKVFYLFVNGRIRGEFSGEVVLDIDSMLRQAYSSSYLVAIHQDRINERDLETQVITLGRKPDEGLAHTAARPYSQFRDFVVTAGLVLILFFVVAMRLNPKLASDYFSLPKLFSSRESDESQASARLTNSSNVQFYVLCSLLMGFYLLIVLFNLPTRYALPIRFHTTEFWMMWWEWLRLSAIIFFVFMLKASVIFLLTRLFAMRGMARFHFFNWIRLLLVVFGAATIVLFMYFIAHGDRPGVFVAFLSLVVVALTGWIALAFFKLSDRSGHSIFHLFSYLCATEIIPLLITVKVLFQ